MQPARNSGGGSIRSSTSSNSSSKKCPNKDMPYPPLEVTLETVDTVVMMLQSKEEMLILQAVWSLARYSGERAENVDVLLSVGVFERILPLITAKDRRTMRFALKLLAEFTKLESPRTELYKLQDTMDQIFLYYAKDKDEFIVEYASKILSQLLCNEHYHLNRMRIKYDFFEVLYTKVIVPDPDIRFNSLQIIVHILRDNLLRPDFFSSPTFTFKPFVHLISSLYPKIQRITLCILQLITARAANEWLREGFRQSGGVQRLLEILDEITWSDLHHVALCTIANIASTDAGVIFLDSIGGIRDLVTFIDRILMADMIQCGLGIFVQLSKSEKGREIMVKHNIADVFAAHLTYKDDDVIETSCYGLAFLSNNRLALRRIISLNVVGRLYELLKHDLMPWKARHAGAFCLYTLARKDCDICYRIVDARIQDLFYKLIRDDTTPVATLMTLIQTLEIMAIHEQILEEFLELETVSCLLDIIEEDDCKGPDRLTMKTLESLVPVKIAAAHTLCALLKDRKARNHFVASEGVDVIHLCLRHWSETFRQTAAILAQLITNSKRVAVMCVEEGYLVTMLHDEKMRQCCPSWSGTIRQLFKYHLPAKFAYTRRLDLNDNTGDYFYATLKYEGEFHLLEKKMKDNISPTRPVYVCKFDKGYNTVARMILPETRSRSLSSTTLSVESLTTIGKTVSDLEVVEVVEVVESVESETSLTSEPRNTPSDRFRPLSSYWRGFLVQSKSSKPTINNSFTRLYDETPSIEEVIDRPTMASRTCNFFVTLPRRRTSPPEIISPITSATMLVCKKISQTSQDSQISDISQNRDYDGEIETENVDFENQEEVQSMSKKRKGSGSKSRVRRGSKGRRRSSGESIASDSCLTAPKDLQSKAGSEDIRRNSGSKYVRKNSGEKGARKNSVEKDIQKNSGEKDVQKYFERKVVQKNSEERDVQKNSEERDVQKNSEERDVQKNSEERDVQKNSEESDAGPEGSDSQSKRTSTDSTAASISSREGVERCSSEMSVKERFLLRERLIKRNMATERGVQKYSKLRKNIKTDRRNSNTELGIYSEWTGILGMNALARIMPSTNELNIYAAELVLDLSEATASFDPFTSPFENMGVGFQAEVIAKFVAKQMSGSDPHNPCNDHLHEVHLNELKTELKTNIIPIASVKIGLHFERALLFKVLGDRLAFPCALVRGEFGRSWVEVMVPIHNPGKPHGVPCKVQHPNHVVDLMDQVGKLLQIGTRAAAEYCNIPF